MEEKKTLKQWCGEKAELVRSKAYKAAEWCKENKDVVIVFGPVIATSLIELVKVSKKSSAIRSEKALKDRYIYDRSTGHYYELRKKPRNSEWIQIEERKQNGESLGWILNDMRLLK